MARLELGGDLLRELNNAVGITPFVVIPGNDLEEAFFALEVVLHGGQRVIDRRAGVMDEVGGDEFFVAVPQDVLEVGFRSRLQGGIDFFDAAVAVGGEGEVL